MTDNDNQQLLREKKNILVNFRNVSESVFSMKIGRKTVRNIPEIDKV